MTSIIRFCLLAAAIGTVTACSYFGGGGKKDDVVVVDKEEVLIEKVYTSKQRVHCEDATGRSLTETKKELEGAGINVFSSSCALITGAVSPSLCGATTLHINIHGIDSRRLEDAAALGYEPLKSLEKSDRGYDSEGCN